MTNYLFHSKDREAQVAELMERIKSISDGSSKIFGVRQQNYDVYMVYLLNPPEELPVEMFGYKGGYAPDKIPFGHTVGSARRDPEQIEKEGKNLERKISEAQPSVAEFVHWTFEYTNPTEQMLEPYHRLLREEIDGWLEQKVKEGKIYSCGSE